MIKFTTLFGLLAVELAVELTAAGRGALTRALSVAFAFVWRSFYSMRIPQEASRA